MEQQYPPEQVSRGAPRLDETPTTTATTITATTTPGSHGSTSSSGSSTSVLYAHETLLSPLSGHLDHRQDQEDDVGASPLSSRLTTSSSITSTTTPSTSISSTSTSTTSSALPPSTTVADPSSFFHSWLTPDTTRACDGASLLDSSALPDDILALLDELSSSSSFDRATDPDLTNATTTTTTAAAAPTLDQLLLLSPYASTSSSEAANLAAWPVHPQHLSPIDSLAWWSDSSSSPSVPLEPTIPSPSSVSSTSTSLSTPPPLLYQGDLDLDLDRDLLLELQQHHHHGHHDDNAYLDDSTPPSSVVVDTTASLEHAPPPPPPPASVIRRQPRALEPSRLSLLSSSSPGVLAKFASISAASPATAPPSAVPLPPLPPPPPTASTPLNHANPSGARHRSAIVTRESSERAIGLLARVSLRLTPATASTGQGSIRVLPPTQLPAPFTFRLDPPSTLAPPALVPHRVSSSIMAQQLTSEPLDGTASLSSLLSTDVASPSLGSLLPDSMPSRLPRSSITFEGANNDLRMVPFVRWLAPHTQSQHQLIPYVWHSMMSCTERRLVLSCLWN